MTEHRPRFVCMELGGDRPRPAVAPPRTVLCLGNFDGVHTAHVRLLREGMRLAEALSQEREEAVACGVLCFTRPSSDAFRPPNAPPQDLTTLDEKLSRFAELGVAYAFLCDFEEVRTLSPEAFIELLKHTLGCVGAVCGFNHRFGAGAVGDASLLSRHFGASAVSVMPEMTQDGVTVSSSAIRSLLWSGDAEGAARLLGRPFSLTAPVTAGKQLGRTLGFPTANQHFPAHFLIPAHGVYAALCHTEYGVFPAVANIGSHPTVDATAEVNCESYLIGYSGNLYGQSMTTEFIRFIRPECRFADIDELQAAIARDAREAETYLRTHGLLP